MAYLGFHIKFLEDIRCWKDKGLLEVEPSEVNGEFIVRGKIICTRCGSVYNIEDGILDLYSTISHENKQNLFERRVRDVTVRNTGYTAGSRVNTLDNMEVSSTIKRLAPLNEKKLLEIGCGTGRFTLRLASRCKKVLAVDFSRESLLAAINNFRNSKEIVGFVQADINKLALKPESYDSALSTLYSNLPTLDIRQASSNLIYDTLKKGGKYVLSAHHHEFRHILKKTPREGKYNNSIYYKNFTKKELEKELENIFPEIKYSTICIWLPYISRIRSIRARTSKAAESIPILNRLGAIILATAKK